MDIQILKQAANQEPAKQEKTLPVIGDNSFTIAVKEKKISYCDEIEIRQALKYVMVKVGLRAQNWPAPTERLLLLNHVKDNFENHSCSEIRLAFEMAINGKLNVDANCYENFSCLYISGIMNAYREWASQEYKLIRNEKFHVKQKIYTDEQILNQRREQIELAFQAMKQGRFPIIHTYFEEILKMDGFFKEGTITDFFANALATKENLYTKDAS